MARILIVTVDPSPKSFLHAGLASLGHQVESAVLGELSPPTERNSSVDLVLLDAIGNGRRVAEACCDVKETAGLIWMPLVVAVDRESEHRIESALDAGADDFVVWPVPERVLGARIESALRFGRNRALVERLTNSIALNESRFHDFAKSTDRWIWEVDAYARFTFSTEHVRELIGFEASEVLGRTPFEIMPSAELSRLRPFIEKTLRDGTPFHEREMWVFRRNGNPVLLSVTGLPIRAPNGVLLGFRGSASDITERKRFEAESFANREFLHQLVEHLPVAVFVKSGEEGRFTFCNRHCEVVLNRSRESVLGKTTYDFLPKDQADFIVAIDREVFRTGEVQRVEEEHITVGGGKVRICRVVKVPLHDDTGQIAHVLGVLEDVTERRAAETSLRASEAKLRAMSDAALDAFVMADGKGRIVHWNPAATRMFGYETWEVLEQSVHDVLAPQELRDTAQDAIRSAVARLSAGKSIGLKEVEAMRKDGSRIPVEMSLAPITIDGKRWTMGVLRDMSARRALQQSLTAALAHLQGVLDSATHVAIVATDSENTITLFNVGAERLLGYAAEEMIGKHTPEVFHVREELQERANQLSAKLGRPVTFLEGIVTYCANERREEREWTMVRKDGKRIQTSLFVMPVREPDGKVTGWLGVALDVTKRKRAEAKLAQAKAAAEEANQAKSDFLANMSHEFRTPLHAVLSFARFGVNKAATGQRTDLLRYFERIESSGQRLLRLVNDLFDLSGLECARGRFRFERMSLADTLTLVVDEIASVADERKIRVRYSAEGDTTVRADSRRIAQVMRNLLNNAVQFSPDGSEVEVAVEDLGAAVRVCVLDRGIGIPPCELETVFEKFVQSSRTRTGAGGTGLGLTICREILEGHGGRIWAENRPDGGTVLTFDLPRRPPRPRNAVIPDSNTASALAEEPLFPVDLAERGTLDER